MALTLTSQYQDICIHTPVLIMQTNVAGDSFGGVGSEVCTIHSNYVFGSELGSGNLSCGTRDTEEERYHKQPAGKKKYYTYKE